MKKFIALLLVVLVAFAAVITWLGYQPMPIAQEQEQTPAYDGEQAAPAVSYKGLDYKAIFALHGEDETVATMGQREIQWRELFYWLYVQASQVDGLFAQMATYYGQEADWSAQASEDMNYSQLVWKNAGYKLLQVNSIEAFAEENGIELTEDDKAAIQAQLENDMQTMLGETVSDEVFNEYLTQAHMTRDMYDRLSAVDYLLNRGFSNMYGENCENVDEAEAEAWLAEKGYLCANHILYLTVDPTTNEPLDEATVAEKRQQAEALAQELAAIEDKEELVERFRALKEEKCEDSGKVQFPDGYTFTSGTMVPAFEDAVISLEDYGVSGVVESSYGFHVILRLPLDADGLVLVSGSQVAPARRIYASELYNEKVNSYIDEHSLQYAEGFEQVFLGDYVVK